MTDRGQTCAVVELRDGSLGILTDRDLRARVLAAGLPSDADVSQVMSAPAYTVSGDRLSGEVLVEMIDRGVRHFPVLSPTGALLGVVDDVDLVAAERRTPFYLRTAITGAASPAELARVARGLRPTVAALHDAQVAAEHIAAIISVVADALVRRLIDLAVADEGIRRRRSRGWRSGASPAARPRRAPTSTARSPGTATTATRRSAPTCTVSRCTSSTASPRAACGPTRRARPRRTASSPARSTRGARRSTRGSTSRPRRRR